MWLYELDRVGFRYPRAPSWTVQDITVTIPARQLTAIIGPNGSGKSTLLKLLGRRLRPMRGSVRYRARPYEQYPAHEWARRLAWLPQQLSVAFPIRVFELVRLGRWPSTRAWFDRPEDVTIVTSVLTSLQLEYLADRWFHELSGGEQQLVHLARALAQQPETLLLDEPLTFLDFRHTVRVLHHLRALVRRGLNVVVILHDLNMVAHFADWVILMRDGSVRAVGPPEEVLRYPQLKEAFQTDVYVTLNDLTGRLIILPLPEAPVSGGAH